MSSNNPHVSRVHIPAHLLGVAGFSYALVAGDWTALAAFLCFNCWFSGFGVSVGFHRYFCHRAFKTSKFWERFMLIGGSFAGQGSVVFWTALHRLHHPNSDKPADVHTPTKGFWHSYMGWIFQLNPGDVPLSRAADLIRDPWCRWTHRNYDYMLWGWWSFLILLAMWLPGVAAGAFIAGCWSIHQEALINSVCHDSRFGTRPQETNDNSRDVHALHYLTWGQSLHNTHHAFPGAANFASSGKRDVGFRLIKLIERTT